MLINFDEPQFLRIVQRALPNAAALYSQMALLEKHPLDRSNIQGYCDAALALRARFEMEGVDIDLTGGNLAVLERCLRFESHSWQIQVRLGMEEAKRKVILAEIDGTVAIINKIRKARGLPA